MNRRTMLQTVATAGAAAVFPVSLFSQGREETSLRDTTLRYAPARKQVALSSGGKASQTRTGDFPRMEEVAKRPGVR